VVVVVGTVTFVAGVIGVVVIGGRVIVASRSESHAETAMSTARPISAVDENRARRDEGTTGKATSPSSSATMRYPTGVGIVISGSGTWAEPEWSCRC